MKKIGIVVSDKRNYREDKLMTLSEFKKWYENGDIIVSCKGYDKFAEEFASVLGLTEENGNLVIYRPEFFSKNSSKYDYNATFKNNTLVAKDSDVLIACVSPNRTGDVEDIIRKFLRFGKDPNCLAIV